MAVRTSESRRTNGLVTRQMNGRKQIFTNEAEITAENVVEVLNKALKVHAQNRSDEQYLIDYLCGKQPILQRVKKNNADINNRIVVNLASQITTFKTSEFAGEPIQYISRGSNKAVPNKVAQLNSMMLPVLPY